jgi:hypothetical protein
MYSFVTTLASDANTTLSPEQTTAIAKALLKILGVSSAETSSSGDADFLKGLATFIGAIASLLWPLAFLAAVWIFRPQVQRLLAGVSEAEVFGVKIKIETELTKSAEEAKAEDVGPTSAQIKRAGEVAQLATQADLATIVEQVAKLAAEYESIRATLPSGSERTRAMNRIAAKMRTIGIAAGSLRYELSVSPSPGKRLQAIACLQVSPDLDMVDWLTERVQVEVPFVSYQALIAICTAAQSSLALSAVWKFEAALQRLNATPPGFDKDPPRVEMLRRFRGFVETLKSPAANSSGSSAQMDHTIKSR